MIELVNLEECVGYVVKVNRRDDITLYGKIRVAPNDPYYPFVFDLGNGPGVCYNKNGRVMKFPSKLDIISIKKIAKEVNTDIEKLNRIVKSIQILSKETDTDAYVIVKQLIGFCFDEEDGWVIKGILCGEEE